MSSPGRDVAFAARTLREAAAVPWRRAVPGQAALVIATAMSVAACQRDGPARNPLCDAVATSITDSSVGPLFVGEAVGALRARCLTVADTAVIVPMPGWVDTVAAKRLMIGGAPVLALHDGARVVALRVTSPGPRTLDGIEVGTRIARFKREPGLRVTRSEHTGAALLQDQAHCGTIFDLSEWGAPLPAMEDDPPLSAAAIATWSDTIVVTAITVSGCRDRSRNRAIDSAFNAREDTMSLPDSLVPQSPRPDTVPHASSPAPAPGTAAPASSPPGTAISASSAELAALRRTLIVPVQGVAKGQLRDTYAEARGGAEATRAHEALDILAPRGTPVLSAADGKLMRLFDSWTGGLMVYAADPSDRFILLYGHLERYAPGLRDGMPLKQGQVIGYVGTTGNAPLGTPHLHFGILRGKPSANWSRGTPVNPYTLLVP